MILKKKSHLLRSTCNTLLGLHSLYKNRLLSPHGAGSQKAWNLGGQPGGGAPSVDCRQEFSLLFPAAAGC